MLTFEMLSFSTLILAKRNVAIQTSQNWFQAPNKLRHIQSQRFWRFCLQLVKPDLGEQVQADSLGRTLNLLFTVYLLIILTYNIYL